MKIMTDNDFSRLKIRTVKSWQGKDAIYVFQSNFSGFKHESIKKFFLLIDTRQDSFGIRLILSKPESLVPQGGMVNQIRKHCKGATVADIFKDTENGNLWLLMYSGGDEWFIRLAKSRPPEMALLSSDATIQMRFGTKGTFTKKQSLEGDLPSSDNDRFKSVKGAIVQELLDQVEDVPDSEEDLEEEDQGSSLSKEQRVLVQKLKRKLKTYRKSYEKQREKIPTESDIQKLERDARLLQSFAYLYKNGDHELILLPELSGESEEITIQLDAEKSIGANIDECFVLAKKKKRSLEMGQKLLVSNLNDIRRLEADIQELQEEKPLAELNLLFDRYKLPRVQASNNKEKQVAVSKPYRTYESLTGHQILVGKGPRENDELTKSARSNDYWVHTSAVAGSHVIIPTVKDLRKELPPQLLKEAAILAIHYSKLREDLSGEVYVARKADIKKQKGMPAGLWNVERCKTLFFRYSEDELKSLLNRLQR